MTTRTEPAKKPSETGLYVVRLYDGFDYEWMDVSDALAWEDALAAWREKTEDGTRKVCYGDIDCYDIFPSNTKMLHSSGT